MVKTLGQLRSENMRLKNEMEVREDFSKRNLSRKKLEKENFRLRNPKKIKFFKKSCKIGVNVSKYAAEGLKKAGRSAVEFEKRQRAIEKKTVKQKDANKRSQSNIRRLI